MFNFTKVFDHWYKYNLISVFKVDKTAIGGHIYIIADLDRYIVEKINHRGIIYYRAHIKGVDLFYPEFALLTRPLDEFSIFALCALNRVPLIRDTFGYRVN